MASNNIEVGIMFSPRISFHLGGGEFTDAQGKSFSGYATAEWESTGHCILTHNDKKQTVALPLYWQPNDLDSCFINLMDVTIGINFHWERKEDQRFRGGLKIMEENGSLTAINILPLEEYLRSVISSEMSATSSEELLKAHAVISRSWLMAQIIGKDDIAPMANKPYKTEHSNGNTKEHIRWYDREDHENFHVCADDHCQRYQGITRASTEAVNKAIDETTGLVLTHNGQICDARYSKCCGGISEIFENVWQETHHPYLQKVVDNQRTPPGYDIHPQQEESARAWITGNPEAFCNTSDPEVLSQVLNDYDQETMDFYRWKKYLTQDEVCYLLKKRIGVNVGKVLDLVPVSRGVSGRLIRLLVKGTEREIIIGKELEIRKAFSESHLYSSAFTIEKQQGSTEVPDGFLLKGAGWGHGVGLCQIGAAVMATKGYSFEEILRHYFKGAKIEKKQ